MRQDDVPPLFRRDERANGATFDLERICWIDFESRSRFDLRRGGYLYSTDAQALMLSFAVGRGPVQLAAVDRRCRLSWDKVPELHEVHAQVMAGEMIYAAHNAAFDRLMWNRATAGFPPIEPEHIIDVAVQCAANGLPVALDGAAVKLKLPGKIKEGKELIALFCAPDSTATPQSHPDEWQRFGAYAVQDVDTMREVFRRTRQLPLAEWREYWTGERINERGVAFDPQLAAAAAAMAERDKVIAGAELHRLTDGAIGAITAMPSIRRWLFERLDKDGQAILTKRMEERDETTGEITKPQKLSLTRQRVQLLLAHLRALSDRDAVEDRCLRVLELREFGGSTTPAKFARMLEMGVEDQLFGSYKFNGAAQTGRYSSVGWQAHNLMRDALPYEVEAINALVAGATPETFARLGDDRPISRKLSMLIRPTLVPRKGKVFVWSDFSSIELRVERWLAASQEAQEQLDAVERADADRSLPDHYTVTAAGLSHMSVEQVIYDTKAGGTVRQRGKVTELALQFGGSVPALQSMAAGYGFHFPEAEARIAVDRWREQNQWAMRFMGRHDDRGSYGLWGALNQAMQLPGRTMSCGRIGYVYQNGDLYALLPSGRALTYRRIKWERVEELDDNDEPTGRWSTELRFARDYGRMKFWPGLACENVVQAVAADCLRGALRRLDQAALAWMPVVLHTHDEIVIEVDEERAEEAEETLRRIMRLPFPWSAGLPLMSEETVGRWYTKAKTSTGYVTGDSDA